jgi:hypothetical protein
MLPLDNALRSHRLGDVGRLSLEKRNAFVGFKTQCVQALLSSGLNRQPVISYKERTMASLCQQMSLRLSSHHKELIRSKLDELRKVSKDPERVTEADAARALIEEAGKTGPLTAEAAE